jgi:hypothetical protein
MAGQGQAVGGRMTEKWTPGPRTATRPTALATSRRSRPSPPRPDHVGSASGATGPAAGLLPRRQPALRARSVPGPRARCNQPLMMSGSRSNLPSTGERHAAQARRHWPAPPHRVRTLPHASDHPCTAPASHLPPDALRPHLGTRVGCRLTTADQIRTLAVRRRSRHARTNTAPRSSWAAIGRLTRGHRRGDTHRARRLAIPQSSCSGTHPAE